MPDDKESFFHKEGTFGEFAALLSADPDDTEAERRFKKGIAALGVTGAVLGIFKVPAIIRGGKDLTGKAVQQVRGGLLATDEGIQALKTLREADPKYRKPVEEFTEEEGVEVISKALIFAREQAGKSRIDADRASNIRGEGVGVPTGKPRPTRDALTKWKTQDTPKDPTIPDEVSILKETPKGISQSVRQSAPGARGVLKRIQQRVFTSRGYYTPKAQTLFDDSKNAQKAAIQEASNISLRIKKSLDNIGQAAALASAKTGTKEGLETSATMLSKVTKALEFNSTKDLYELPRSERIEFFRTNFGLTEDLAREVYKSRELIDGFSKRIYNSSTITPDQRASLESGIGSYIRRSYRAWEDPGFVPDSDLKIDAIEATYK